MDRIQTDILVIGSGAAGLRAAVAARGKGARVTVIGKLPPGLGTATILSGGGFAAAVEGMTPQEHFDRTMETGRGINDRALVEVLAAEGGDRLLELIDWGMEAIVLRGSVSAKGKAPAWGKALTDPLTVKGVESGVEYVSGLVVWRLLNTERGAGAIAYRPQDGAWVALEAKVIILAAGGAGALFLRHDNPQRMTGDGYALAAEAGLNLQDMEFAQFFPVATAVPGKPSHLVSPRLADLGKLVNDRGEDLLKKYDITVRPAAIRARDKLSQALFNELNILGNEVTLDLTGVDLGDGPVDNLTATNWVLLKDKYQADKTPIQVAPTSHFFVGGVTIDQSGRTNKDCILACGEVTGGVHGANRMGGNALTEAIVFGARAGETAADLARGIDSVPDLANQLEAMIPAQPPLNPAAPEASKIKTELRTLMWNQVGIVRNHDGLSQALAEVSRMKTELWAGLAKDTPKEFCRLLELDHALKTARLIIGSALLRKESRGVHFRSDFPETRDIWLGRVRIAFNQAGEEDWAFDGLEK